MDQYLTRFAYTKDGAFGRWGRFHTVEEEWQDNQPRISCIPTGIYRCVRSTFHRGGYPTFEVTNVPGRTLIKVHRANTEEDLLGCIGIGLGLGVLTSAPLHRALRPRAPPLGALTSTLLHCARSVPGGRFTVIRFWMPIWLGNRLLLFSRREVLPRLGNRRASAAEIAVSCGCGQPAVGPQPIIGEQDNREP